MRQSFHKSSDARSSIGFQADIVKNSGNLSLKTFKNSAKLQSEVAKSIPDQDLPKVPLRAKN